MKTDFKAKYLQHLARKNKDKGFTLIELLVVIIIVGVLAAIALPSFLNQIGKARGSEAKSTLGVLNRAQQAYRMKEGIFASNLGALDAKYTEKFYTYEITPGSTTDAAQANTRATPQGAGSGDLKAYSSRVEQTSTGSEFSQIICESADNYTTGMTFVDPSGTDTTSDPTSCGAWEVVD